MQARRTSRSSKQTSIVRFTEKSPSPSNRNCSTKEREVKEKTQDQPEELGETNDRESGTPRCLETKESDETNGDEVTLLTDQREDEANARLQ